MRLSRITRIATASAAAALVLTATACGNQAELGGSGAPAPTVAEEAQFGEIPVPPVPMDRALGEDTRRLGVDQVLQKGADVQIAQVLTV